MPADGHDGQEKDDHEDAVLPRRHEQQHAVKERVNHQKKNIGTDEPIVIVKEREERLLMDFLRHFMPCSDEDGKHGKAVK